MRSDDVVAHVDVYPVAIPLTKVEQSATITRSGFDNVLVRVETDGGVVGWGEASGGSGAPISSVAAAVESLRPFALGESVFRTERLRKRAIELGRMSNVRRLAHLAIAAYDIAFWDAAGKILGRPIHELLGGAIRSEVDFYAYVLTAPIEEMVAEASALLRDGFQVLYVKVGLDDRRDEELVGALRTQLGDDARIRVDATERWDQPRARRMISRLAHYELDFLEQPLDSRDLVGARDLRRSTLVPLAANQGIWSVDDVARAISGGICDVIVTGPLWLGGLLPMQRAAVLCAEMGVGFCRHASPETSIATAAGLHVCACVPDVMDGSQTYLYFLEEDVSDALAPRLRGRLPIPDGPGLGISVDEDQVAHLAGRYQRDGAFVQNV